MNPWQRPPPDPPPDPIPLFHAPSSLFHALWDAPWIPCPRQEKRWLLPHPPLNNGCGHEGLAPIIPTQNSIGSHPLDWPLARFSANFSSTTS